MTEPNDQAPPPPPPRKPYHAPRLRYLGSVREVTLGSATTGPADAKGRAQGRKGG